ncbi:MAG: asparagine synthase-related protein [Deltaproteobacteria bacterium]|nr:asparagine synthase-related protein [Deltaproteobacteria bacterium]
MRFRIIAGPNPSPFLFQETLPTLFTAPGLLIQGDKSVFSSSSPKGEETFRVGNKKGQDKFIRIRATKEGVATIDTDSFGQIDLYFQTDNGITVFATDLSLLRNSKGENEFDPAAVAHVLTVYGYRPPKKHTLFKNVHRLGIGESVLIQNGKMELCETPFEPLATQNYGEEDLNRYADLFLEAVASRSSAKGNVVYLSSGWDSTSILACLVKLHSADQVRAVIGRMTYAERSGVINQFEIDRAKAVADYFKVRLDIVDFDYRTKGPDIAENWMESFKSHQIASIATLNFGTLADFVARTTNGEETVFVGEISDGVHNLGFSQFATIFHPVMAFREYSDKMASYLFGPTFLDLFLKGEGSNDPIYGMLRSRCGSAHFDAPAKTETARRSQLLASFFLRTNRLPLWSLENNKVLTSAGRSQYSETFESIYLNSAAQKMTPETVYSWYLHLYNSFHWQGATVASIDKTARAKGLETALPFWDKELQNFLQAMPESWGRGLEMRPTKYPLKQMLQTKIDYPLHLQVGPHSYLYDVDHTFSHTAEILYGSSFTPYFKDSLRTKKYRDMVSNDFFDITHIDNIVNRYLSGEEVRGLEMNELLSLCYLSMS